MPAIGDIKINILADTAKLYRGLNESQAKLAAWAAKTAAAVSNATQAMERQFQKVGTALTTRLTVPMAALAYASVKAADPLGNVSNSVERLGLQAQKALRPLGDVLIRTFEEARPAIEAAIGSINAASQAFANLDPETQRTYLNIALLATAAGPASLALASVFKIAGFGITVLTTLTSVMFKLSAATAALSFTWYGWAAAISAATGMATFQLVNQNFATIFRAATTLFALLSQGFSEVKSIGRAAAETLQFAFESAMHAAGSVIIALVGKAADAVAKLTSLAPTLASKLGLPSADSIRSIATILDYGGSPRPLEDRLAAILRDRNREASEINSAMYGRLAGVNAIASSVKNVDPVEMKLSDFLPDGSDAAKMLDWFEGISDGFTKILDKGKKLAADGGLPFVRTKKEVELLNASLEEASKRYASLYTDATRIRLDVLPEESYRDQVERLRELKREMGDVIDDRVFDKQLRKIQDSTLALADSIEGLGARIAREVEGWSSDMGRAFADFAIDGERSLGKLLISWTKTLIAMTVQAQLFAPIAQFAGGFIRSFFAPGVQPNVGGAGGAPSFGGNVAFAAHGLVNLTKFGTGGMSGGVAKGPTAFPLAMGMIAEAGRHEAYLPLANVNGDLGVAAMVGGGGVSVQIIDQRGSGQRPQVSEQTGADGRKQLRILIRDEVASGISDGSFDKVMGTNFGVGRRSVSR